MKPAEKLRIIAQQAAKGRDKKTYDLERYPRTVLDIVLFHKLHLEMKKEHASRSYQLFGDQFVDWNEVRVSSVREIQEHLKGAENSLDLAVFIKDFLEFVQRERHSLCLEFLAEQTLTDVRRFFKPVKGLDASTIDMVLLRRREHPVFPLNANMERVLEKLGIVRKSDTRDRKQKLVFKHLDPECTLHTHHFLLDVSRALSPPGDDGSDLPPVGKRSVTEYLRQIGNGGAKGTRAGGTAAKDAGGAPASQLRRSRSKVIRRAVAAKRVGKPRSRS